MVVGWHARVVVKNMTLNEGFQWVRPKSPCAVAQYFAYMAFKCGLASVIGLIGIRKVGREDIGCDQSSYRNLSVKFS